MAPRAYWKGYLKLSLVSCPIALYPASSSSERVSFHRINKKTGNRLKQQLVDAETGDPVEKDDVGRGYEVGKGEYLQVSDEELEKIEIESTHTIEIDSFVPRGEIDDRYLNAPYYITPTDKVGQEAFVVIRDAIKEKKMVGLGRVVLTRREHVMMLEAFDKGLLATTLRYPYEVRDQAAYFEDHYEASLVELLKAKQAGRALKPPREEPRQDRVINLMDALRASIKSEAKKPAAASTASRRPAKGKAAR
jgi:DNA end-binding protein Ku